jgi:hypothetical protein
MGLAAVRQQQRTLAVTTADRPGAMLRAVVAVAERIGMDIIAVLLALVVFGLMFGLIRALKRI